ncbi:MAG: HAMP domain-containing histidine kinase [Sedimentisphaerales bacterium]|nr:HAMP domain-containing histidine kinase [Sedimentisphaerales bacterium]
MTSIIEKRLSLHKSLADQQKQNDALKSHISQLQALANIGSTMYMIAHEINNLLTPLSSYATFALNNLDDEPIVKKALERAVQNCQRASKIMDSMLTLTNGQKQQNQHCQLSSLIKEIFDSLCRDFAKDKITVNIVIAEDIVIWAVPVQIQQVLMNLILNARDAMLPRGGILTIKAQENSDSVQIEVTDSGSGIKPDDLKKIFEPFSTTKADKKSSLQHSGSGLGLAFCKRIIDSHGGCISVESELDKASTFRITLPKPKTGNNK